MQIPPPLPQPSFVFGTNGGYSADSKRVFAEWSDRIEKRLLVDHDVPAANELVKPRLFLLADACKKRDILYIVMHHRFCQWSRSRQHVHHLMQPFRPQEIDRGFAALGTLLKPNDSLTPQALDWFCDFPAPTFDAYVPTTLFVTVESAITLFLTTFAAKWREFQGCVFSRGFPVLVWETQEILHCTSWVTQGILFTLSRRLLGIPDGPISAAFTEVFAKDRTFESKLVLHPLPQNLVKESRDAVAQSYIDMMAQLRHEAATRTFNLPSICNFANSKRTFCYTGASECQRQCQITTHVYIDDPAQPEDCIWANCRTRAKVDRKL